MEVAVQHHHAGRIDQAEQLCRLVLQSDPNHPAALHLSGVIAHQAGKHWLINRQLKSEVQ
jgi:hypothetical protein